ncbi:MAG: lycopene cyclase domain-containing protein [Terrimesophilobacter sp.]
MIYLILSIVFVMVACLILALALARPGAQQRRALVRRWTAPVIITGVALVILTAVFDNIMIALGFMVYSQTHVTGISVGLAPLEDFSYPLAGLILLPALWLLLGKRTPEKNHD